jgi:hypothetical protein
MPLDAGCSSSGGGLAVYKRELEGRPWRISFLFPFHPFAHSKISPYKQVAFQTKHHHSLSLTNTTVFA